MEITIAPSAGFCFGVSNAVGIAEKLGNKACVLGKLIHNASVLDRLALLGVITVDNVADCPKDKTLVIRSHGVSKSVYEEIDRLGLDYCDATCPFVAKIHKIIENNSALGNKIVIIGDKGHPEVVGSAGWACDKSIIVSREEDAEAFEVSDCLNYCVVVQTTFDAELYNKIIKIIKRRCKSVVINRTICYTTTERQKQTAQLAKQCDAVLVLGSAESSNTSKLYGIAKQICPATYLVENIDGLPSVAKNITRLGITAGASTPKGLIEEVKLLMSETQETKAVIEDVTAEQTANVSEAVDSKGAQAPKKQSFAEMLADSKKSAEVKLNKLFRNCTVISANEDGIYISFGGKKDGFIDKKDAEIDGVEYDPANYKYGDKLDAIVIENNNKSQKSGIAFSKKLVDIRRKEQEECEKIVRGSEFKVTVGEAVKGGLTAKLGPYTVFIPASQIKMGYVNDLDKYVGKQLRLRMIQPKKKAGEEVEEQTCAETSEIKISGKRIVASQRVILEEERARKEEELWQFMEVGKIVSGKVKRFAEFGAFVSVHGFDCLAHISDLSYYKIERPEEVLEKDKTYDFVILRADRESGKVSLGYKQLQKKPYEIAAEKFPVGSVITGPVRSVFNYGAFILIDRDVDGLLPVAEIAHTYTKDATNVYKVGDEVTAQIIKFDDSKITLSVKALTPAAVEEEVQISEEDYKEAKEKRVARNAAKFDRSSASTGAAPKKKKTVRENAEADSVSSWSSDASGATFGDLFKGLNLDFEDGENKD
ncbi:MAG: 4-hydroxy-3-methylbut-2-enyl diphosphate reductase [Clostridia bacterium]|nr:4-hydroxy-3-methylbut-2-enyl diphosphate reductase [Clostridia bacterium]